MSAPRVVVGLSGASGAVYGVEVLRLLRQVGAETHLVVTEAGEQVLRSEAGLDADALASEATYRHRIDELTAPIASGTFATAGMIIAPCSIRTLSAVACCRSSNLLERAADVTLKERRPLLLLVRETPLHRGHLRLMLEAAEAGAVIMPPVPAFYTKPHSLEDVVRQTAARALDAVGLDAGVLRRWSGPA